MIHVAPGYSCTRVPVLLLALESKIRILRFSGGFFGSLHLCFQLGGNASAVEAHGLKGNIQNDVIDAELIAEQDASNCLHDA